MLGSFIFLLELDPEKLPVLTSVVVSTGSGRAGGATKGKAGTEGKAGTA